MNQYLDACTDANIRLWNAAGMSKGTANEKSSERLKIHTIYSRIISRADVGHTERFLAKRLIISRGLQEA